MENKFKNLTFDQSCDILWEHYLSRKIPNNEYEPSWTHNPYDLVRMHLDRKELSRKDYFLIEETIKSHTQKDGMEVPVRSGFPNEGTRIMHDCWKAGSFTWIFMGRSFCQNITRHKDFVVVERKLPDEIYRLINQEFAPQSLYAAYKLEEVSTIGPAISLDQLFTAIEG
jgi:hypothetical protein